MSTHLYQVHDYIVRLNDAQWEAVQLLERGPVHYDRIDSRVISKLRQYGLVIAHKRNAYRMLKWKQDVSQTWQQYLRCQHIGIEGQLVQLSPQQNEILNILLMRGDEPTTIKALIPMLWSDPDWEPEGPERVLQVMLTKLRNSGIPVENEYSSRHKGGARIARRLREMPCSRPQPVSASPLSLPCRLLALDHGTLAFAA